jgi:hypothetical protein
MIINFPDNAEDGQTFVVNDRAFVYDYEKKTWKDIVTTVTDKSTKLDISIADITNTATVSAGNMLYYNSIQWANTLFGIDNNYLQASHQYAVTSVGTIYKINQIDSTLNNPTLVLVSGTTVSFKLDVAGHPFRLLTDTGEPYNTGLVHVALNGTVSAGADAQGKETGTLYWQVPADLVGNFSYQCTFHGTQTGGIKVRNNRGSASSGNYTNVAGVLTLDLSSPSDVFDITISQNITSVVFNHPTISREIANYELIITLSGDYSITWGTSVKWPTGTPPVLSQGAPSRISLITTDNAATFNAIFEGSNYQTSVV